LASPRPGLRRMMPPNYPVNADARHEAGARGLPTRCAKKGNEKC